MTIFFLLLSSLFLFQVSCFSQNGTLDERYQRSYREIRSLYPRSLVSHLPKKIDNTNFGFIEPLFPRGRYLNYIHLALTYTDKEIANMKKEAALEAKAIYSFEDACLVLPYDYKEFEIIKSDSVRNIPFTDMLPIPNFSSWECGFTTDFYKDAVIYLLDAEPGRFLSDDCLSKSGVGLPKKWEHGYTKGLLFYKNVVIYWLEVW